MDADQSARGGQKRKKYVMPVTATDVASLFRSRTTTRSRVKSRQVKSGICESSATEVSSQNSVESGIDGDCSQGPTLLSIPCLSPPMSASKPKSSAVTPKQTKKRPDPSQTPSLTLSLDGDDEDESDESSTPNKVVKTNSATGQSVSEMYYYRPRKPRFGGKRSGPDFDSLSNSTASKESGNNSRVENSMSATLKRIQDVLDPDGQELSDQCKESLEDWYSKTPEKIVPPVIRTYGISPAKISPSKPDLEGNKVSSVYWVDDDETSESELETSNTASLTSLSKDTSEDNSAENPARSLGYYATTESSEMDTTYEDLSQALASFFNADTDTMAGYEQWCGDKIVKVEEVNLSDSDDCQIVEPPEELDKTLVIEASPDSVELLCSGHKPEAQKSQIVEVELDKAIIRASSDSGELPDSVAQINGNIVLESEVEADIPESVLDLARSSVSMDVDEPVEICDSLDVESTEPAVSCENNQQNSNENVSEFVSQVKDAHLNNTDTDEPTDDQSIKIASAMSSSSSMSSISTGEIVAYSISPGKFEHFNELTPKKLCSGLSAVTDDVEKIREHNDIVCNNLNSSEQSQQTKLTGYDYTSPSIEPSPVKICNLSPSPDPSPMPIENPTVSDTIQTSEKGCQIRCPRLVDLGSSARLWHKERAKLGISDEEFAKYILSVYVGNFDSAAALEAINNELRRASWKRRRRRRRDTDDDVTDDVPAPTLVTPAPVTPHNEGETPPQLSPYSPEAAAPTDENAPEDDTVIDLCFPKNPKPTTAKSRGRGSGRGGRRGRGRPAACARSNSPVSHKSSDENWSGTFSSPAFDHGPRRQICAPARGRSRRGRRTGLTSLRTSFRGKVIKGYQNIRKTPKPLKRLGTSYNKPAQRKVDSKRILRVALEPIQMKSEDIAILSPQKNLLTVVSKNGKSVASTSPIVSPLKRTSPLVLFSKMQNNEIDNSSVPFLTSENQNSPAKTLQTPDIDLPLPSDLPRRSTRNARPNYTGEIVRDADVNDIVNDAIDAGYDIMDALDFIEEGVDETPFWFTGHDVDEHDGNSSTSDEMISDQTSSKLNKSARLPQSQRPITDYRLSQSILTPDESKPLYINREKSYVRERMLAWVRELDFYVRKQEFITLQTVYAGANLNMLAPNFVEAKPVLSPLKPEKVVEALTKRGAKRKQRTGMLGPNVSVRRTEPFISKSREKPSPEQSAGKNIPTERSRSDKKPSNEKVALKSRRAIKRTMNVPKTDSVGEVVESVVAQMASPEKKTPQDVRAESSTVGEKSNGLASKPDLQSTSASNSTGGLRKRKRSVEELSTDSDQSNSPHPMKPSAVSLTKDSGCWSNETNISQTDSVKRNEEVGSKEKSRLMKQVVHGSHTSPVAKKSASVFAQTRSPRNVAPAQSTPQSTQQNDSRSRISSQNSSVTNSKKTYRQRKIPFENFRRCFNDPTLEIIAPVNQNFDMQKFGEKRKSNLVNVRTAWPKVHFSPNVAHKKKPRKTKTKNVSKRMIKARKKFKTNLQMSDMVINVINTKVPEGNRISTNLGRKGEDSTLHPMVVYDDQNGPDNRSAALGDTAETNDPRIECTTIEKPAKKVTGSVVTKPTKKMLTNDGNSWHKCAVPHCKSTLAVIEVWATEKNEKHFVRGGNLCQSKLRHNETRQIGTSTVTTTRVCECQPPFCMVSFPENRQDRFIWVGSINRRTAEGELWVPGERDFICCLHFKSIHDPIPPVRLQPNMWIIKPSHGNIMANRRREHQVVPMLDSQQRHDSSLNLYYSSVSENVPKLPQFSPFDKAKDWISKNRLRELGKAVSTTCANPATKSKPTIQPMDTARGVVNRPVALQNAPVLGREENNPISAAIQEKRRQLTSPSRWQYMYPPGKVTLLDKDGRRHRYVVSELSGKERPTSSTDPVSKPTDDDNRKQTPGDDRVDQACTSAGQKCLPTPNVESNALVLSSTDTNNSGNFSGVENLMAALRGCSTPLDSNGGQISATPSDYVSETNNNSVISGAMADTDKSVEKTQTSANNVDITIINPNPAVSQSQVTQQADKVLSFEIQSDPSRSRLQLKLLNASDSDVVTSPLMPVRTSVTPPLMTLEHAKQQSPQSWTSQQLTPNGCPVTSKHAEASVTSQPVTSSRPKRRSAQGVASVVKLIEISDSDNDSDCNIIE